MTGITKVSTAAYASLMCGMATTLHCPQLLSTNRLNQIGYAGYNYTGLISWYKLGLSRMAKAIVISQPRIFCLAACKLSPTFSPAASYLQHNTHTTCTQLHAYVTKQVLIPRDLWTNTTLALSNNWDNKAVPLPNVHTGHISSLCMHLRALALRIVCITLSGAVRPWLL